MTPRPLLLSLLAIALVSLAAAPAVADGPVLDPALPYQARKSNPVTYDVDFEVIVTAPAHTRLLKVWLPLPQTDAAQRVEEKGLSTFPDPTEPRIATEKVFGNKFAYYEFAKPEGAKIIRHRFKITLWELHWDLDPDRVAKVEHWPAGFAPYLRSDHSVVVDDRFREAAHEAVPRPHGEARDLTEAFAWVRHTMRYDHTAASLRASAEHALTTHVGHCSDFHGLCAALGRALGYPTRVTYGINAFPKNSPSHCKVEAYLPPYGWVSFDVAETHNMITAIGKDDSLDAGKKERLIEAATERLRQGFRDNTWYLQTRGTDYELAPPASRRVPVVRTIYAEADGVPLPDPDPANFHQNAFAWMTAHRYVPDHPVTYPFKDYGSLLQTDKETPR